MTSHVKKSSRSWGFSQTSAWAMALAPHSGYRLHLLMFQPWHAKHPAPKKRIGMKVWFILAAFLLCTQCAERFHCVCSAQSVSTVCAERFHSVRSAQSPSPRRNTSWWFEKNPTTSCRHKLYTAQWSIIFCETCWLIFIHFWQEEMGHIYNLFSYYFHNCWFVVVITTQHVTIYHMSSVVWPAGKCLMYIVILLIHKCHRA